MTFPGPTYRQGWPAPDCSSNTCGGPAPSPVHPADKSGTSLPSQRLGRRRPDSRTSTCNGYLAVGAVTGGGPCTSSGNAYPACQPALPYAYLAKPDTPPRSQRGCTSSRSGPGGLWRTSRIRRPPWYPTPTPEHTAETGNSLLPSFSLAAEGILGLPH